MLPTSLPSLKYIHPHIHTRKHTHINTWETRCSAGHTELGTHVNSLCSAGTGAGKELQVTAQWLCTAAVSLPPGGPSKPQMAESTPHMEFLIQHLGWWLGDRAQNFCISSKFPGNADAAGPGPQFENHSSKQSKARWMFKNRYFHKCFQKSFPVGCGAMSALEFSIHSETAIHPRVLGFVIESLM